MRLQELLKDKTFDFYGVCANCFKLGDTVFEAVENESDGYRSYLDSIVVNTSNNLTFSRSPICKVNIIDGEYEDGFSLCTPEGVMVLNVGTDETDNYYPCFRFEYVYPASMAVLGEFAGHKAYAMLQKLAQA